MIRLTLLVCPGSEVIAHAIAEWLTRYLTIRKFSAESGYSEAAVRSKTQSDVLLKGQVWHHAPDGRGLIDVQGC
ncbi:phage excisionase [Pseudomonas sp. CFII64]|nr:phage excisionase [Pseudomonas sp. CFII64]